MVKKHDHRGNWLGFLGGKCPLPSHFVQPDSGVMDAEVPARHVAPAGVGTQRSSSIRLITQHVANNGVYVDPLLLQVGLDLRALPPRVAISSFSSLIEVLDDAMENSLWGLDVGNLASSDHLELLGYAVATAPTVQAGLEIISHYASSMSDLEAMHLDMTSSSAWLRLYSEVPSARTRELGAQFYFANIRETLQGAGASASRIHLLQSAPRFVRGWPPPRSVPIIFQSDQGDAIELAKSELDRVPSHADERMHRFFVSRLEEMRAAAPSTQGLSNQIRQLLESAQSMSAVCVENVASSLGMSERTLQRRLRLERLTWSDVLDEVRRERALTRVKQGARNKEVAEELGYSEPRAFFRAFRRWTGRSPSEWKQQSTPDGLS